VNGLCLKTGWQRRLRVTERRADSKKSDGEKTSNHDSFSWDGSIGISINSRTRAEISFGERVEEEMAAIYNANLR
jgi:hypothetical protein